MIRLLETDLIDPEGEAHYAVHSRFSAISSQLHNHDFFELFVIQQGAVRHIINGQTQLLNSGTLVFIRPDDAHYYQQTESQECQLLNLAFPVRMLRAVFGFLGEDFQPERLLSPALPPSVMLANRENKQMSVQFNQWNQILSYSRGQARLELRTLLATIFIRYFPVALPEEVSTGLDWLDTLCREMRKPEHFITGVGRMQALAHRSPEHLARTFKQHLHKTPTEFVNNLRLDYAASQLAHTDKTIVDVALESGFDNLSHFYRQFQRRFQMPPKQYRRAHHKSAIP